MFRFVQLRLAASALSCSRHETQRKKKKKKMTREEDISQVCAGRKRRKPLEGWASRRNRPTVPCYYLRSRGESAFLSGSLPSFLPSWRVSSLLGYYSLISPFHHHLFRFRLVPPCALVLFSARSSVAPLFSDVLSRKTPIFSTAENRYS